MGRKITQKGAIYAHHRGRGLTKKESAILAGAHVAEDDTVEIEDSKSVKEELSRIRAETAANAGITKEDVAEMLLAAYRAATLQSEPQSMVAAARELGKLLGHYAPEVKKTLHGLDETGIRQVLDMMSDAELLKIANGRIIDGTSERIKALPGNGRGTLEISEQEIIGEDRRGETDRNTGGENSGTEEEV